MRATRKIRFKWWWIPSLLFLVLLVVVQGNDCTDVHVIKPHLGSISESIPANGKVKPVSELYISPDVSGEIVEIFFREGDFVHKGELLLKIKPDIYTSILEQSTAALKIAKTQFSQQQATLNQATLHFERSKALYEKGVISLSEYQDSEVQYTIARQGIESAGFQIQSAKASVKEARENLAKTSIYSPMEGTITQLLVERGERVVGTSQMAGTQIMKIADMSQMEIVVEINENDIFKVSEGDSATIRLDAVKGIEFAGRVTKIANTSKRGGYSSEQIASFEVNILIMDNIPHLKPGMSASVTIYTDKKDNIITIPLRCINSNGCIFVVRNDNSSVEERKVTTGIQDLHNIEILEGVGLDEEVVIAPYEAINKTLTDNGKIHIDRD